MKTGIHPDYHKITVQLVNGTQYESRSTFGKTGDVLRLDIDPSVHPAWTGSTKVIMQTGSVAKFNKRFSKFGLGSSE